MPLTGPQLPVSVVVPCFHQAHFLPRALDNISRQSVRAEVVVVDDASPDDVAAVCARFPFVRYIRQEHRGVSAARNRGIVETRGDLLHFLDADDAPGPGMYAALAGALSANRDWAAAVSGTSVIHEDGSPSTLRIDPPRTSNLFVALARRNLFPPGAVLVRRAVLEQTGPFDETLDATADWDLWLRVARTGAIFGGVHGPFFEYRTYPASMSRADPLAMLEAQREILLRATRPDPRVRGTDTRFAMGVGGREHLDDALTFCVASSMGLAIGHRRLDDMSHLLRHFAESLRGRFLTVHHLHIIIAEASITLGFLPPDRERTRSACAASLSALRTAVRNRSEREILDQIVDFLNHGVLVDTEGNPIIPVPVRGSMSARVPVTTQSASSLTTLIAPWRAPVDGIVRVRIFDPERGVLLRESDEAVPNLSSARTVCFRFEVLKGLAGRVLDIELTPDTSQPIAVYEPAASAKMLYRRVLRKMSLDRRGRRLYCRII